MKHTFFFSLFLSSVVQFAFSQNPICPPGVYIADPTARVDKNGKMYVYGSRDESPDYYCSESYNVLSSNDLSRWNMVENTFTSSAENVGRAHSGKSLYAPDMIERNGKYYLYYCLSDNSEGVATSLKPDGVFERGAEIQGITGIDPTVFIDDDGQAYYFWGQFSLKGARMNSDMKTLDAKSIKDSIITEKEHFFHEGSFMFKREGIYYLVFADISRQDRPTCLGYATSDSPLGVFTYRGVIIDNAGSDPSAWNNHGSVAQFNGQWYVFYHRPTHNCAMMRKACVEPISFCEDGSIPEVPMTSQGAGKPLPATKIIDAARVCLLSGNTRIREMENSEVKNEILAEIRNGDRAAWKYIDCKGGVSKFSVRLKAKYSGSIAVLEDYPWRQPKGILQFYATNDWQTVSCNIGDLSGIHTLWLQFYGEKDKNLLDIDWIKFE